MNVSFRTKLSRGDLLIGTIITLPSPVITEICCQAGFDWLFVDLEHGALSIRDAQVILQSSAQHTPCAIRVPALNEAWIKKALDIGANGIIIPHVQTAEEAHLAVQLCKYPPAGVRSVGIARAHGYGEKFQEYTATANDKTAVILQIEHIDAVHNIEAILNVPDIDCLFIGPYDLSASMGKTGLTTDPEVQKAIMHVKESAKYKNTALGIFGITAEAAKPYIQSGYTLIAASMDTLLLSKAAKEITTLLKG